MRPTNDYLNGMAKSMRAGRLVPLACAAVLVLLLTPRAVAAYDNDTHFWLTYYLAVKAGYNETQATQIASANVGVDFDKDTEPLLPWNFDSPTDLWHMQSHFQSRRVWFHALPLEANVRGDEGWWNPTKLEDPRHLEEARRLVDCRQYELWEQTLDERQNPGVFLHYLQDTFAHEGFTSYVGHAGYSYVDFLHSDDEKAELMALETLKYLLVFREALAGGGKPETFPYPKTLNIEDLRSPEEIRRVKQAVAALREANRAPGGVQKNKLVTRWEDSGDSAKRAYRLPSNPVSYFLLMLRIKSKGPVPDSAKARRVVQELLGLGEDRLPHVWLYDFNGSGKVAKGHRAKEALVYVPRRPKKGEFRSGDEARNTRRRRVAVNGKRRCLPYSLEETKDSPAAPPACD